MSMQVQPYLFFNGRADEAIEFYHRALGAEKLVISRFGDSPVPTMLPPGNEHKVMHGSFRIGTTTVLCSDGMCDESLVGKFSGFSLTIMVDSSSEVERLFHALAEGGQIQMPLSPTFFASLFGMVADRFGISWMIIAEKKHGEV